MPTLPRCGYSHPEEAGRSQPRLSEPTFQGGRSCRPSSKGIDRKLGDLAAEIANRRESMAGIRSPNLVSSTPMSRYESTTTCRASKARRRANSGAMGILIVKKT